MIHFVMAKSNASTLERYKKYHGESVSELINIIHYQRIAELNGQACHAIVFSDLDRLSQDQIKIAADIANDLLEKYPGLPVLNHPGKVKLRYDLLRQLYRQGLNDFNVYRVSESLDNIRYPVFIREENEHTGALTGLIRDRNRLDKELRLLAIRGYRKSGLLVVEFCDVLIDQTHYHKYSAMRIADLLTPRAYDLDDKWMVKSNQSGIYTDEFFQGMKTYFEEFPHRDWIEKIFKIAHIEYGRADFSVVCGKPQLWEINLNPSFGGGDNFRTRAMKKRLDKDYEKIRKLRRSITNPNHETIREQFRKMAAGSPIVVQSDTLNRHEVALQPNWKTDTWRRFRKLDKSDHFLWKRVYWFWKWSTAGLFRAFSFYR